MVASFADEECWRLKATRNPPMKIQQPKRSTYTIFSSQLLRSRSTSLHLAGMWNLNQVKYLKEESLEKGKERRGKLQIGNGVYRVNSRYPSHAYTVYMYYYYKSHGPSRPAKHTHSHGLGPSCSIPLPLRNSSPSTVHHQPVVADAIVLAHS